MYSKSATLLSLAALVLVGMAYSQVPQRVENAPGTPSNNLAFEPIGAGDLLHVYVANSADNTLSVRVAADGTIRLPALPEAIQVRGMVATEIEKVVSVALTSNKILVQPVVSVSVLEYRSKPVVVVGAVKDPVTLQAIGNLHLLDALAKAGGLTSEAGSQILVTKPGLPGQPELEQQIPVKALLAGQDSTFNVLLTGGEQIRVPGAGKFYVVGNVKTPGAYSITEGGDTTVLKALALCQGTLPYAQPTAFVYRKDPLQPGRKEIAIPIRQMMKRQVADFHLEAEDILYIPDNAGKRMTAQVLDRIAGFSSSTAGGVLVYASR